MSEVKCEMPTKEEFIKYVTCQMSGKYNMFDLRHVGMETGLSRKTIISVMDNYDRLMRLYPDVRK